MSLLNPGKFLTGRNLVSMGFQFPELGLFSLAIALSMITGGIDLSVVSVANLAGILAGLAARSAAFEEAGLVGALLVGLGTGALCGAANGWLVARRGVTPILATLGTMQLFAGVSYVTTKGHAVHGFPEALLSLGNGTLLGAPVPLVVFAAVSLLAGILLGRTRFGLRLYLIGTSERAAVFAGIDVQRTLFRTYVLTGILAGATGLLMMSRANSAKADYGTSYLLQAVLVAILGGVSPTGGSGSVAGLVLAVLSLQLLSSGFNMLRWSSFAVELTWGALLIATMAWGAWSRGRASGRGTP
jgi:simple sugar transport system permease protein